MLGRETGSPGSNNRDKPCATVRCGSPFLSASPSLSRDRRSKLGCPGEWDVPLTARILEPSLASEQDPSHCIAGGGCRRSRALRALHRQGAAACESRGSRALLFGSRARHGSDVWKTGEFRASAQSIIRAAVSWGQTLSPSCPVPCITPGQRAEAGRENDWGQLGFWSCSASSI